MLDDVKRITGTVADVPDLDETYGWDESSRPGLFVIDRDDGGHSGPFRLDGHDIRHGDRIDADWRPPGLNLSDVRVIRGEAVQDISEIRFV